MEFCKLHILFRSFFTQAGEFSRFHLINGLCYVQVFLKVTSFFSGDDKSPIVAGFWHFVSLSCAGAFFLHSRPVASVLWHLMFASFRLMRPRALNRRSFARRTTLPRENREYCAWLLRSLQWIIPFSFMINASSKLLSSALPKNNGQGLILWRKGTVSKCFRRLEKEKNASPRQHLPACPSSYRGKHSNSLAL